MAWASNMESHVCCWKDSPGEGLWRSMFQTSTIMGKSGQKIIVTNQNYRPRRRQMALRTEVLGWKESWLDEYRWETCSPTYTLLRRGKNEVDGCFLVAKTFREKDANSRRAVSNRQNDKTRVCLCVCARACVWDRDSVCVHVLERQTACVKESVCERQCVCVLHNCWGSWIGGNFDYRRDIDFSTIFSCLHLGSVLN